MKRVRFLSLTAAQAALPLAAAAQSQTPVRMGTAANDSAAEAYYAQDLGLFQRAGLNVDLSTFPSGVTMAQAVVGGALDVGGHNIVSIAEAVSKNIPLALLAGGSVYSSNAPTTVMCVLKSSPLSSAKDLEGKTVSVLSLRDITYASASAWVQQNGGDVSKVKFIEIPFPQALAALERGTVDAAMIAEPSLSVGLRSSLRIFAKPYDVIGKQFIITVTFASSDWIRKNAEDARKVSQAIYEAGRWANVPSNRPKSAAILAKYAKLEPATIAGMTRASYAPSQDLKLFQPPLDFAYKFKIVDRQLSASELFIT